MMTLPETWTRELKVIREESAHRVALSVTGCDWAALTAARETFLHPDEAALLERAGVAKRQADFLRGRYAAKCALSALHGEAEATSINVVAGVFGQPVVRGLVNANAQVSIAHSGGWAAALAGDETHPMAIDLECHDPRHAETIRREATGAELAALAQAEVPETHRMTVLWAVREALAKVLRTGLMAPLAFYEVGEVKLTPGGVTCAYRHFAQYHSQCYWTDTFALAIALPRKSFLPFEGLVPTVGAR